MEPLKSNFEKCICNVCPKKCVISDGGYGLCGARTNILGKSVIANKDISTIIVDEIEQRPLYHFLPFSKCFSVGYTGCSLKCDFCINHEISQIHGIPNQPAKNSIDAIELFNNDDCETLCFTFNEPSLRFELIEEARQRISSNKRIVLKTSGYMSEMVCKRLCKCVDAVNVDLKGSALDYQQSCSGEIEPVLDSIETFLSNGAWTEISYIPGKFSNEKSHIKHAKFIHSLGGNVPVHVLKKFPAHKCKEPERQDVVSIHEIMSSGTKYCYLSNARSEKFCKQINTYCNICGKELINRQSKHAISTVCCGHSIDGIFN